MITIFARYNSHIDFGQHWFHTYESYRSLYFKQIDNSFIKPFLILGCDANPHKRKRPAPKIIALVTLQQINKFSHFLWPFGQNHKRVTVSVSGPAHYIENILGHVQRNVWME